MTLPEAEILQQEPETELQDHYATWRTIGLYVLLIAGLLLFIQFVIWAMQTMEPMLAGLGIG